MFADPAPVLSASKMTINRKKRDFSRENKLETFCPLFSDLNIGTKFASQFGADRKNHRDFRKFSPR